jgi:chemotaxis signal transduction protein
MVYFHLVAILVTRVYSELRFKQQKLEEAEEIGQKALELLTEAFGKKVVRIISYLKLRRNRIQHLNIACKDLAKY